MKIHNIDFAEQAFNRPDSMKPSLQEGTFYLKARFVCPFCPHSEDVLINKDKEVYHECNQGNVRTLVPELKISVKEELPKVKLLKNKNSGK